MGSPTRRMRIALCVALIVTLFFFFTHVHITLHQRPILSDAFSHKLHDTGFSSAPQECTTPPCQPTPHDISIEWFSFAYTQYVTNEFYLCNSLLIFESLRRHDTKAQLLMLYPNHWTPAEQNDTDAGYESQLLAQARDEYGVTLSPIEVRTYEKQGSTDHTWEDSYTKLFAFNQTQYKRVIALDSDATVLDNMDELFLLPPTPVAMPRAYWLPDYKLSSQIIVIQPSETEFARIERAMQTHQDDEYDMDILHKMYASSSMIIPHRKYDLLSAEFRSDTHDAYLGSREEMWDAKKVLAEAKLVHFSEWPLPKPWIKVAQGKLDKYTPACRNSTAMGREDCSDREVWLGLRTDFSARREVCEN
ncbi:nucleotide-diphospho-sugar transferase [Paraphoma chrysanthemicola]|nr:nucleotide-diphospho-sugar transferase [Paraphoma chrysanthemicola]